MAIELKVVIIAGAFGIIASLISGVFAFVSQLTSVWASYKYDLKLQQEKLRLLEQETLQVVEKHSLAKVEEIKPPVEAKRAKSKKIRYFNRGFFLLLLKPRRVIEILGAMVLLIYSIAALSGYFQLIVFALALIVIGFEIALAFASNLSTDLVNQIRAWSGVARDMARLMLDMAAIIKEAIEAGANLVEKGRVENNELKVKHQTLTEDYNAANQQIESLTKELQQLKKGKVE